MNGTSVHSGGPRTAEGKARCRVNALRHGGRASTLIACLAGEERFAEVRERLAKDCRPVGPREEQLVDQLAQHAVQAGFTGLQLRAAVRDATRNCEAVCGAGTEEDNDAALRMSVEVPAVRLASRYNASAMAGFARTLALLRALQSERQIVPCATRVLPAPLRSSPSQVPPVLARLRDIIVDDGRRPALLWELYCRHGGPHIAPGNSIPPFDPASLATALTDTFLARTGLAAEAALLFAAEYLSNPETPVSALCSRAGLRRRATALRLRDRLRPSGEASRDWLVKGLEAYLRSP